MPQWVKVALLLLALLLVASIPLARQFETGSIEGLVTSDRGAVANASVEARNVMTGTTVRVVSDPDGRYKLEDLRPGRYSLRVGAPGFDLVWIPQIIVERGQVSQMDVRLNTTSSVPSGS